MKKRVLSLLAACAVITTSFVGLVQNVYAEGHNVRITVSDTDTETEKTLKFYYEGTGADGLVSFNADLSISEGGTINTFALSAVNPAYKGTSGLGNLWFSDDNGAASADGEFATATVTVSTDKDITVSLKVNEFFDSDDWEDYSTEVGTVQVVIPAKSTPSTKAAEVTAVEKQNTEAISGTGQYESQKADIYGVQITAGDKAVTGAEIYFDEEHKSEITFGTVCSANSSVQFAVILAKVSANAVLPTLEKTNVVVVEAE